MEQLNGELLVWVMALEATHNHLIMIPDSLPLIPILAPGGNLLVEINDGVDDERAQVITEDQAESQMLWVEGEEVRVLGVEGEIFEEGEDMLDILWRVVAVVFSDFQNVFS